MGRVARLSRLGFVAISARAMRSNQRRAPPCTPCAIAASCAHNQSLRKRDTCPECLQYLLAIYLVPQSVQQDICGTLRISAFRQSHSASTFGVRTPCPDLRTNLRFGLWHFPFHCYQHLCAHVFRVRISDSEHVKRSYS